jgi:hypothetical protein
MSIDAKRKLISQEGSRILVQVSASCVSCTSMCFGINITAPQPQQTFWLKLHAPSITIPPT